MYYTLDVVCTDDHKKPACVRVYVLQVLPAFKLASDHSDRVALLDNNGEYTYRGLLLSSNQLACEIRNKLGTNENNLRIAFLCPNNASYVIAQWATWIGGNVGKINL